jgi:hypothetical protein
VRADRHPTAARHANGHRQGPILVLWIDGPLVARRTLGALVVAGWSVVPAKGVSENRRVIRSVAVAVACALLVGCAERSMPEWSSSEGMYVFDGMPAVHRDDIVSVTTQPIPEGDPAPVFVDHPHSVEYVRQEFDLDKLRPALPDPLPATLDQGDCQIGGVLVIKTADRTIAYGPCQRPQSINNLWTRLFEIATHGECRPVCGPGDTSPTPPVLP